MKVRKPSVTGRLFFDMDRAIKKMLDQKIVLYNRPAFIIDDPISIPHHFTKAEDIEISAFLTATIAWGNRKSIIRSANRIMDLLDNAPFDFVVNHSASDLKRLNGFVHRTFSARDLAYFLQSLQNIYLNHGGLRTLFSCNESPGIKGAIMNFRQVFLEKGEVDKIGRHISNPSRGSAAKRINMFLRWMVRNDAAGVDFGIWKAISPSQLMCPLDVHSGRVARKLGLLMRPSDDWKAVEELTFILKQFDSADPVKYDYALFGMGVNE